MSVYVYPAVVAALAVLVFAARRPIRRLYAPPRGGRTLALTWGAGLSGAVYGCILGPASPFLGLGLLTGGAFIAIMASALWKEEQNRADGLPDDHTRLPERLGWFGRMAFTAGAVGSERLRRQLGAALTPEQAEELRRRSVAHGRNPERAIPLDEALEQIERGLR